MPGRCGDRLRLGGAGGEDHEGDAGVGGGRVRGGTSKLGGIRNSLVLRGRGDSMGGLRHRVTVPMGSGGCGQGGSGHR